MDTPETPDNDERIRRLGAMWTCAYEALFIGRPLAAWDVSGGTFPPAEDFEQALRLLEAAILLVQREYPGLQVKPYPNLKYHEQLHRRHRQALRTLSAVPARDRGQYIYREAAQRIQSQKRWMKLCERHWLLRQYLRILHDPTIHPETQPAQEESMRQAPGLWRTLLRASGQSPDQLLVQSQALPDP